MSQAEKNEGGKGRRGDPHSLKLRRTEGENNGAAAQWLDGATAIALT
jgi:hypothetical protein